MNLLDKAESLGARVKVLDSKTAQQVDLERYITRKNTLKDGLSNLDALRPIHSALQAHNVSVELNEDFAVALHGMVREVTEKYSADPESIILESEKDGEKFWKRLNDFVIVYLNGIHSSWKKYINDCAPVVEEEMLQIFERLEGFSDSVKRIRKGQKQLEILSEKLPQDANEFSRAKKEADYIREAWSSIQGDNFDSDILDFLKAAAGSGATLKSVTPKIAKWLEDNELDGAFKISLGRSWG